MSTLYNAMVFAMASMLHYHEDEVEGADDCETLGEFDARNKFLITQLRYKILEYAHYEISYMQLGAALAVYLTTRKHKWVPKDGTGVCVTCNKSEREGNHTEFFCYYCAEPLEDGLCSASCHESEGDEGRDCECEEVED